MRSCVAVVTLRVALRRLSKSVADVRSPTIRNMLKQMEEEVVSIYQCYYCHI